MVGLELLIVDVDGTLVGDEQTLGEFAAWWAEHGASMRLVYSSVRFFGSVQATIEATRLPPPNAIIGGLGTEIHRFPEGVPFQHWQDRWWPHWDAARVRRTLAGFEELQLQSPEAQSAFKTSYHIDHPSQELLCAIRRALAAVGVPAGLVYSSPQTLDVLPRGANTGAAGMFLAQEWGVPRHAVAVAGQSGSDASLYLHGCCGILVASAPHEFKTLIGDAAYLSRLPYAAGVVDGLRYWLAHPPTAFRGRPRPAATMVQDGRAY